MQSIEVECCLLEFTSRCTTRWYCILYEYYILSGLSYRASGGLLAGEPGGRPCPLRLIWTGRGTVHREITVPNLLYCSNFSYYFPPTWSRGGWQFEVSANGSVTVPVWPFYLPWAVSQCPFDPYRAARRSIGRIGQADGLGGRPAPQTTLPESRVLRGLKEVWKTKSPEKKMRDKVMTSVSNCESGSEREEVLIPDLDQRVGQEALSPDQETAGFRTPKMNK
jgi:hypothetical protein